MHFIDCLCPFCFPRYIGKGKKMKEIISIFGHGVSRANEFFSSTRERKGVLVPHQVQESFALSKPSLKV